MPYWPEWPFPIYWSSPRTFPSPCTTFSIATWVHGKSSPMVGPCSHCSMLTIRWCSTPFPCGWQCCWPCGDTWLSGKCIALQNNILYFLCIFKECVVFSYKFQVVWTPANFKEFCTENLTQSMSLCWRTVQKYSVVLSHSSNFLLDNIHSTKNNELPIVCAWDHVADEHHNQRMMVMMMTMKEWWILVPNINISLHFLVVECPWKGAFETLSKSSSKNSC